VIDLQRRRTESPGTYIDRGTGKQPRKKYLAPIAQCAIVQTSRNATPTPDGIRLSQEITMQVVNAQKRILANVSSAGNWNPRRIAQYGVRRSKSSPTGLRLYSIGWSARIYSGISGHIPRGSLHNRVVSIVTDDFGNQLYVF
jgi:hypothetical protein